MLTISILLENGIIPKQYIEATTNNGLYTTPKTISTTPIRDLIIALLFISELDIIST